MSILLQVKVSQQGKQVTKSDNKVNTDTDTGTHTHTDTHSTGNI